MKYVLADVLLWDKCGVFAKHFNSQNESSRCLEFFFLEKIAYLCSVGDPYIGG